MRLSLSLALFVFAMGPFGAPAIAENPDAGAPSWSITEPHGEHLREISFETDRGTWMSVDVSPDGTWLAFDLLGHVYRLPIDGGEATCLTVDSGVAVNRQPVISPDGQDIAFLSDRTGQDNLWLMDADGSDPHVVLEEKDAQVREMAWAGSSEWLVVLRTAWGKERTSDLRLLHRDGGQGLVLTSDESRVGWPDVSGDGRFLFFQHHDADARDLLSGKVQIRRMDLETGAEDDITAGVNRSQDRGSSGSAFAPRVSPDGTRLAFARRIPDGTMTYRGHDFGPRTALWIRDLETGAESLVLDPIERDMAVAGKSSRALPGYDWLPDGSGLVLSRFGRLERLDPATGKTVEIPFRARVERTASEAAKASHQIGDGPVRVRFPRWHTRSSRGDLAYEAAGRIWVERGDRLPQRITEGVGPLETTPAWSPDGLLLAYTTWGRPNEGHVVVFDLESGKHETWTSAPGEYLHPTWRPDGRELAVVRGSGATWRGRGLTRNEWWSTGWIPAGGGDFHEVARAPRLPDERLMPPRPSWGPGQRIAFHQIDGKAGVLVSVDRLGKERLELARVGNAEEIVLSPDGRHIAFQAANEAYVAPIPVLGREHLTLELDPLDRKPGKAAVPLIQLTEEGGLYPRFTDAEHLEVGDGDRYLLFDLSELEAESIEPTETKIELGIPRRRPSGTIALEGARLVTLGDAGVVETGAIVIRDGRLACVGDCDVEGVDRVFDVSGTTIVPGFIDLHAHHHRENLGVLRPRDPEQGIALAYGVTTSFNPYTWAHGIFPMAEATEAGEIVGPRVFSTGDPLEYGVGFRKGKLDSLERIRQVARRQKDWGAIGLKQYVLRRRDQRQWVSEAARELGLLVTAEGSYLEGNLAMILDGHTAWEHSFSYVPMGPDAARFFGGMGAVYSPTFVVGGPAAWNEEFYYQRDDIWKDEKLRRWLPWRESMPHTRHRMLRPESDYAFPWVAEGLADIIEHGGLGVIGAHGQHHGIGAHWEIWMAASALGPQGALEVASLHGAKYLGLEEELGSLEVGKLADLLVLEENPLEDIENTTSLRWVMKDGILWGAESLDEIWPLERPFGPRDWLQKEMLQDDSIVVE